MSLILYKISSSHWKKLTCFTTCRKHGISVELAWNHENSILIPYCGSFKFHIAYAETGYQLWNQRVIHMELKVTESDCGKNVELKWN